MKKLLIILIICAYGSIDAMASRLVMQSFRHPGIVPTSSRSLEIAKRWQHQDAQTPQKSVEEIKALTDRIKDLEHKVKALDAKCNTLDPIEKPNENIKDVVAVGVGIPVLAGVGVPVVLVSTCMLLGATLSVIEAILG